MEDKKTSGFKIGRWVNENKKETGAGVVILAVVGCLVIGLLLAQKGNASKHGLSGAESGVSLDSSQLIGPNNAEVSTIKNAAKKDGYLPSGSLLMGYIIKDLKLNEDISDTLVLRIIEISTGENVHYKPEGSCYLIAPADLYKGEFVRPAELRCYDGEKVAYGYPKVDGQVITSDSLPDLAELDPAFAVSKDQVVVVLTKGASRGKVTVASEQ